MPPTEGPPNLRPENVLAGAFLTLLLAAPTLAGGSGENALLVVDPANAESMYVANYYKEARGLPDANFLYVAPGASSYVEFAAVNAAALLGRVGNAMIGDHVDYVIVPPGGSFFVSAPGHLTDACFTPSRISIGSAYGLTFLRNEILNTLAAGTPNQYARGTWSGTAFDSSVTWVNGVPSTGPGARRYYIGAMLGYTGTRGNTLGEILAMIDRSAAADGTFPAGTFYYVQTTDPARSGPRHNTYPTAVTEMGNVGGVAQHIMANLPVGNHDVLGVMTGLASPDIDGADMTLLPGTFADHLTSFAGMFDTSSQTKMSRWIAKGASGSAGAVEEPCNYPQKFPHARMHVVYRQGLSLGEAWFRSMNFAPFQLLLYGDPLTRPFSHLPTVNVPNPPVGSVIGTVVITPTALATAPGAVIEELDLLVDGIHTETIASGSFSLDTATLSDGWHELRVLGYDDRAERNVGRWIGSVVVNNNPGRSVSLAASVTAGDLAQDFDLTVTATGTAVDRVLLWNNGRVVGSTTSASDTIELYGWNLGAGPAVRVHAEALYTDGVRARSSPIDLDIDYSGASPAVALPEAFGYERTVLGSRAFTLELPAAYDEDPSGAVYTVLQGPTLATIVSSTSGPYRVLEPVQGMFGADSITFQVTTTAGTSNVATIGFDIPLPDVDPETSFYGCNVNPAASMTILAGEPVLGGSITFGVDNPTGLHPPGSFSFVALSKAPDPNFPCGTLLPGFGMTPIFPGELLVSLAAADRIRPFVPGSIYAGAGTPAPVTLSIPFDPVLLSLDLYAQGVLFDPIGTFGVTLGLADAVRMLVGL